MYVGRNTLLGSATIVALNINDQKRQKALLLHYAGEDVNDIFDTLPNTAATNDENPFGKAVDALTAYFSLKENVAYEEYQFHQAKQDPGDKIMAFYTRLKRLSETCDFADSDRKSRTQIIQHCVSTKLRRKAVSEPSTSLGTLIEYGKTLELPESQISALENRQTKSEGANKIKTHLRGPQKSVDASGKNGRRKSGMNYGSQSGSTKCRNWGGSYPHEGSNILRSLQERMP